MAAETTQAPEAPVPVEEVVVPEAENPVAEDKKAVDEAEKPAEVVNEVPIKEEEEEEEKKVAQQSSFKEETNVVSELPESQRKALEDLKKLIQEALEKHEFSSPPSAPLKEEEKMVEEENKKEEEQPPAAASEAEKPTVETAPPSTAEAESPKTEEEAPKSEDPTKAQEEASKTEEKEPAKTEEEARRTEQAPKALETTPAVEEEETVEAIKETIVEVVAAPPPPEAAAVAEVEAPKSEETTPVVAPEEVSIWGVPLLADERSDVILLKFLRARDFKVKDAYTMIKNTVRWRKEFGVDSLLEEDLGSDYEKVVFTHGLDKEGRPVVYNVFGEFQNKELYQHTFSDAEKRKKFLKWLIQFLEKTIRTLDFSPKGTNTLVLVNDFKNSPGFGKRDLYKVINKFLQILQDNYPEFVAKQLCINVSWWYLAYNWISLTVFTPRSKSKFVFASPSRTPDILFKYIAPEQVPIQFGGHSKDGDEHEFSPADPITEVTLKPGSKHPIEFALSEGSELVWELRVVGWEVSYGAEFFPAKDGGYTLNISKLKKVAPSDEPIICDTFKVTEAGKVVLTIDNQTTKKKKLFYRSKMKA